MDCEKYSQNIINNIIKFYKMTNIVKFCTQLLQMLLMKPIKIKNVLNKNTNNKLVNKKGVYIISNPKDDEIVYAGMTKDIIGRIKDHKNGSWNSDLGKTLKKQGKNKNFPINNYLVRYVNISDENERKYFEDFVIFVLQPSFNKK